MAANLMPRSYENMAEKQLTASDAEADIMGGDVCDVRAPAQSGGAGRIPPAFFRVPQTGAKARQTDGTPVRDVTYAQTAAGVRIAPTGSRPAGRLASRLARMADNILR